MKIEYYEILTPILVILILRNLLSSWGI